MRSDMTFPILSLCLWNWENIYFTGIYTVNTSNYTYNLPPEKIAIYPLLQRDSSKLLIYRRDEISHSTFRSLSDFLPSDSFLFFNNTKVIPARLLFKKESGASIEIFLLNPVYPSTLLAEAMGSSHRCTWQCAVGNLKKWPEGVSLEKDIGGKMLRATIADRRKSIVDFSWEGGESFAGMIGHAGETPLPPYIKRKAEAADAERYQTIYSHHEGAVAAPTAGLHFTDAVFNSLSEKNIYHDFLTLHVSAGTFQPIKKGDPNDHVMHKEQIIVNRKNIENLLVPDRFVVAVGTTSMRTLESLYWYGAKLISHPDAPFTIGQRDAYTTINPPTAKHALTAVREYMLRNNTNEIIGETSIFIYPGYNFKICRGLITNFHQPASTLILLVAAFVGEDWKRIYNEALDNGYRFLSYGDSSLLLP